MSQIDHSTDPISDEVRIMIHDMLGINMKDILDETHFKNDMDVDSLDLIELQMAVEKRFSLNMPEEVAETLSTVGKLIAYVKANQQRESGVGSPESGV